MMTSLVLFFFCHILQMTYVSPVILQHLSHSHCFGEKAKREDSTAADTAVYCCTDKLSDQYYGSE